MSGNRLDQGIARLERRAGRLRPKIREAVLAAIRPGKDALDAERPLALSPRPLAALHLLVEVMRTGRVANPERLAKSLPRGKAELAAKLALAAIEAFSERPIVGRTVPRLAESLLNAHAIGGDTVEGSEMMFDEERTGHLHEIRPVLRPAERPANVRSAQRAALDAIKDLEMEAVAHSEFDRPGLSIPVSAFAARFKADDRTLDDLDRSLSPIFERAAILAIPLSFDVAPPGGVAAELALLERFRARGLLDMPGAMPTISIRCIDDGCHAEIAAVEEINAKFETPVGIRLVASPLRTPDEIASLGLPTGFLRVAELLLSLIENQNGPRIAMFSLDPALLAFASAIMDGEPNAEVQRLFGFPAGVDAERLPPKGRLRCRIHAPIGAGRALADHLAELLGAA